ncbi:MAG: hypothetical protein GX663_04860 [Clostridiales bacterium]|nr:hypothetical protein [Clostridiales bacterium]
MNNERNNRQGKTLDRVLIIGSNHYDYDIIKSFLDDIDVICENAANGAEAASLCCSADPDYYSLILTDINLLHDDCSQIVNSLRNAGINSPVEPLAPFNKFCVNMEPYEFYFYIAPWIKNAMELTKNLEKAIIENGIVPTMDPKICNAFLGVYNMGGNVDIFIKHFNNFKDNNRDLVSRLGRLIEDKEYSQAMNICLHSKEMAGMLALTGIHRYIVDLEALLVNPSDGQSPTSIISAIGKELEGICQIQF